MLLRCVAAAATLFTLCSCPSTPPAVACTGTTSACSGSCVDLQLDALNCGSCGTACPSGQACATGACFPVDCNGRPCEPNQVCASGSCVDRECVGVLCPSGQTCSKGTCVCASPRTDCSGACADTTRDDLHCGACSTACAAGEGCAQGACLPNVCADESCDPLSLCWQGRCVERACVGVVCPGAESCRGGVCNCQGSVCSGACTNTKLDDSHCGACGTGCDAGTSCAAGQCFPDDCAAADCDPLSVCYQGTCIEAECVGVLCSAGKLCSRGRCVCATGKTDCGGECATLAVNAQHCGACDKSCDGGQACTSGTCVSNSCPPGQTQCGASCVDTSIDPQNCGQCGDACGGGRNCVGGQCTCPQGLSLCGASCVNLSNDPQHCAACGRSCNGGTCAADGGCSCPPGLTGCTGSCRDLSNDPQFCGSCTRACPANETCSASVCQCQPGFSRCNGVCMDTRADTLNCGMCGRTCSAGQACAGSACVAPVVCQTNFNAVAVAACPAFPITTASCNAWTMVTPPDRFMGQLTNPATSMPYVLTPVQLNERVDVHTVFTTMSSTAGMRQYVRNDAGVALQFDITSFNAAQQPTYDHTFWGTQSACTRPYDLQLSNFSGTANFDITATRFSQPGFNKGGVALTAPAPIALLDGGAACDLLCGASRPCTPNEPLWYSVTVPANGALAIYTRLRLGTDNTSGNFALHAWDDTGRLHCTVVSVAYTQTSDYTGRIVNNLPVPQQLRLAVQNYTSGGADVVFTVAVALEQ